MNTQPGTPVSLIPEKDIRALDEAIASFAPEREEYECEFCGDTGIYEFEDIYNERTVSGPCVCQAEDANNREMIKGGDQHKESND